MKNDILLIIAKQDEKVVAGALNFISKNTLYGRNWGSIVNIPFLHFELCYYQAIEYAIEKNIKIVEAGAQGHHKIQRVYIAKPTYSNHFVLNDSFAKAIKNFTETPSGNGKIDTYTVINGRKGLEFALIVGTLDDGTRLIANSEKDEILLNKMIKNEMLDAKVFVSQKKGKNIFNLI